ncbi:hypothetical protein JRO89_XS04G0190600 [Xanthoceras sorbifolium]|uniref:Protein LAZY 1-like n=1 Tax=Xanthoceras sorbifolium TaxID=99658 RepID=A0ABQ8I5X5_9ROSI|nr:hypothetical protein JRO89_XS04G0190600 [Xanthoceras sorbifolium]
MRMFNWIHNNKRNGACRHVSKKLDLVSSANHYIQKEPAACKEEFIDWPHGHGLLAIGTIGNTNLKEITDQKTNLEENPPSPQEDLTPEEEGILQNELDLLLSEDFRQVTSVADHQPEVAPNFSLDKFVVKQSRDDAVHSEEYSSNKQQDGHVQRSTSVVYNNNNNISRGKDICYDHNRGPAISKKTLSFLLKKMFVCRSGFPPAPSLRDPISESPMEKILRAILHKKIYPQSSTSSTTLSAKKYLENRHKPKSANYDEDDENDKGDNGSKWVKTDSEYIVLEI